MGEFKKPTLKSSICIVGAGPGGLSMAHYLKKSGYKNITILEKQAEIGGKCLTKNFHGRSFDMGANYLTPDYVQSCHGMAPSRSLHGSRCRSAGAFTV